MNISLFLGLLVSTIAGFMPVRRGFSPYSMLMKNQYFKRDLPGSHRVAKRASDSLADHDKNDIFYEMF